MKSDFSNRLGNDELIIQALRLNRAFCRIVSLTERRKLVAMAEAAVEIESQPPFRELTVNTASGQHQSICLRSGNDNIPPVPADLAQTSQCPRVEGGGHGYGAFLADLVRNTKWGDPEV